MTEDSALDEALQNLSSKKHTVSENARRAKEEKRFEGVEFVEEKKWYQKRTDIIDEFNKSVALLITVFNNSKFDELALFMASPARIFIINLFIGIFRGIGFALGFIALILLFFYLVQGSLPSWLVELIIQKLVG